MDGRTISRPGLATPAFLSGFTYIENNGPSPEQSISVTGASLTTDITVTATENWEISATSGAGFGAAATLPAEGGSLYTRLRAGLPASNAYNGEITLAAAGVQPVTVALLPTSNL